MTAKFKTLLDNNIPDFAAPVELKLPKLKKIGDTKQPKIKLPKLKKA